MSQEKAEKEVIGMLLEQINRLKGSNAKLRRTIEEIDQITDELRFNDLTMQDGILEIIGVLHKHKMEGDK